MVIFPFFYVEFRECFYLYARSGQIKTFDELTLIIRSLGMSPTIAELKRYFQDKSKKKSWFLFIFSIFFFIGLSCVFLVSDGKLSFADFLDIMHVHTQKENIPKEILDAFKASDRGHKGQIPARELRHILLRWGDKLNPKEGMF